MTVRERLVHFLTTSSPKAFCDDCVACRIGLSNHQAQHETSVLGEIPGFSRRRGFCSNCNKTMLVILYAPRCFDLPPEQRRSPARPEVGDVDTRKNRARSVPLSPLPKNLPSR